MLQSASLWSISVWNQFGRKRYSRVSERCFRKPRALIVPTPARRQWPHFFVMILLLSRLSRAEHPRARRMLPWWSWRSKRRHQPPPNVCLVPSHRIWCAILVPSNVCSSKKRVNVRKKLEPEMTVRPSSLVVGRRNGCKLECSRYPISEIVIGFVALRRGGLYRFDEFFV